MADVEPGAAAVTDHRVAPRGVLPRNTQTWLMVGLAVTIVGIIVFVGHPQPVARPGVATTAPPVAPSPDRLREYQDRLRILDERARQQAAIDPLASRTPSPTQDPPTAAPSAGASDPLQQDRKRREDESLFSSNVVMSRRPDGQQLVTGQTSSVRPWRSSASPEMPAGPPSVDEVADAVVRATSRYAPAGTVSTTGATTTAAPASTVPAALGASTAKPRPAATGPITSTGPLHRI